MSKRRRQREWGNNELEFEPWLWKKAKYLIKKLFRNRYHSEWTFPLKKKIHLVCIVYSYIVQLSFLNQIELWNTVDLSKYHFLPKLNTENEDKNSTLYLILANHWLVYFNSNIFIEWNKYYNLHLLWLQ